MALLFLNGVFDGISLIIRRSRIRLISPDHLLGRVALEPFLVLLWVGWYVLL